jgi:hypothetical protein
MREKFTHPLWRKLRERAEGAGHGGMDFVINWNNLHRLHKGQTPDSVVYDAAAWSSIIELSSKSVATGSMPVPIPDFTPRHLAKPATARHRREGKLGCMALVRIFVDGYSLLHNWPELAPGKPRYSMEARDELIRILTLYRDATNTPITIVFDGAGKSHGTAYPSTPELEILYSRSGQTADQIIERVTARMQRLWRSAGRDGRLRRARHGVLYGGTGVQLREFYRNGGARLARTGARYRPT